MYSSYILKVSLYSCDTVQHRELARSCCPKRKEAYLSLCIRSAIYTIFRWG